VFWRLCRLTEGTVAELIPLAPLWNTAGSPQDRQPREWIANHTREMADQGVVVEDRGEAALFADYQSAAWYAQALDPTIEPWHIVETFY
jgi:hypothetical protein